MNKAELIDALAQEANVTKADAERVLNALIETVVNGVKKGEHIAIAGLGSFERVAKAARTGINPATGAQIKIAAKKAPKFKAAKAFKDAVASAK